MESEIQTVRNNPLLDRREVKLLLNHQGEATPSEEDVKSRFAAEKDVEQDSIEIKSIYTGFGQEESEATLQVYQEFEYEEELESGSMEDEEGDKEVEPEVENLVDQAITEVKDEINEEDEAELKAALEAEKQKRDRKTLKKWLKNKLGR